VPLKGADEAPAFRLATVEGRRVALEDHKGKNIILFFFTTWCPYCTTSIVALEKKRAALEREGIVVLPINAGESQAKVAAFRERRDISYDILLDKNTAVAKDYGVIGVPTYFLVAADGALIYDGNDLPWNYMEIFSKEDASAQE